MFNWSDKTYKWVKWSVLLLIPTLGLAYQKLGAIWNFPMIEQIKATIDVVVYCLAVVLGINCAEYSGKVEGLKESLDTIEASPVEKKEEKKETPKNSAIIEKPVVIEKPAETVEVKPVVEISTTAKEQPDSVEVVAEPVTVPESAPEPAPTPEDNGVTGSCICEVGKEYILTDNLKVRESYGTNSRWLKRSELTPDGQAHSVEGEMAVLQSGASVTCLEVVSNWLRIPSGWICGRIDGVDTVKLPDDMPCYPCDYLGISTYFGYDHPAIDIGYMDNDAQPILAPCDMEIVDSGWDDTVGYYIRAYCNVGGSDYTLRFIHMRGITVGSGRVSKRTQIGVMGDTGSSCASGAYHLHFDVWTGHRGFPSPHDSRVAVSVNPVEWAYIDGRYQSVGDVTAATYPIRYM